MSDPILDYNTNRIKETIKNKKHALFDYYRSSVNSSIIQQDVSLYELIIKSSIEIDHMQMMSILSLDKNNTQCVKVYKALLTNVEVIAKEIVKKTKVTTIDQLPLTNVLKICYRFSKEFSPIFFCATRRVFCRIGDSPRPLHIHPRSQSSTSTIEEPTEYITIYLPKFTQNWPIFYMLKDKIKELNSKQPLTIFSN